MTVTFILCILTKTRNFEVNFKQYFLANTRFILVFRKMNHVAHSFSNLMSFLNLCTIDHDVIIIKWRDAWRHIIELMLKKYAGQVLGNSSCTGTCIWLWISYFICRLSDDEIKDIYHRPKSQEIWTGKIHLTWPASPLRFFSHRYLLTTQEVNFSCTARLCCLMWNGSQMQGILP